MSELNNKQLPTVIRDARDQCGLSLRAVANLANVNFSTISRIEAGEITQPSPAVLSSLGSTLGIPLADLFAMAGYIAPRQLPAIGPYFRARYNELPEEAAADVAWYAEQVAQRYGITLTGPAPGEDEK